MHNWWLRLFQRLGLIAPDNIYYIGGSETLPPVCFAGAHALAPRCSAMAWRNISSVLRIDASREYCLACSA